MASKPFELHQKTALSFVTFSSRSFKKCDKAEDLVYSNPLRSYTLPLLTCTNALLESPFGVVRANYCVEPIPPDYPRRGLSPSA